MVYTFSNFDNVWDYSEYIMPLGNLNSDKEQDEIHYKTRKRPYSKAQVMRVITVYNKMPKAPD